MKQGLLSIVFLSYQSEKRISGAIQVLIAVLEKEGISFEIIIVDDGSKDNSYQIARTLSAADNRINTIRLSKNYTSPYAFFAGLSVCSGACATSVPDDLQRSPELVVRLYRMWQSGAKVVIPYRLSRNDGRFNDWFSNTYYATMNRFSTISFPPGGADAFLADREIIQLLNHRVSPKLTSPVAEVLRMGFDPVFIGYDRPASKNPSRWTFTKKLRLFADNFFGASNVPLRFITLMGFCVFIVSLLLILLIVGAKTFSDNTVFGFPVRGWATLMIFITMFNGLILLSIGVVAEYIWRIFEEVKNRPAYIIRKEDEV